MVGCLKTVRRLHETLRSGLRATPGCRQLTITGDPIRGAALPAGQSGGLHGLRLAGIVPNDLVHATPPGPSLAATSDPSSKGNGSTGLACRQCGKPIEKPRRGRRLFCPVHAAARQKEQTQAARVRRMASRPEAKRRVRIIGHASMIVQAAVKAGTLVRPIVCPQCGRPGTIHSHHEDYMDPLNVMWLCPKCHKQRHVWLRKMGIAIVYEIIVPERSVSVQAESAGLLLGVADTACLPTPLTDSEMDLGRFLSRLTARQGQIIRERWLNERSLDAVGMDFHISRERVRQIEAHAMARMKFFASHATAAVARLEETP